MIKPLHLLKITILALLAVVLQGCQEKDVQDVAEPSCVLSYIEFGVRTYADVTFVDIEKYAQYRISIWGVHSFTKELVEVLAANESAARIRSSEIRLKVDFPAIKQVYYVDRLGTVSEGQSGRSFQLDEKELKWIDERIRYLHGVVDLQPTIDPYPRER